MVEFGKKISAREAAYLALWHSLTAERYISDTLVQWRRDFKPTARDFNLAQEIAFGSARMALSLDFLAKQLIDKNKLNLKLKEKALLRCGLYQFYYMDRIPDYAIVDETVAIASRYCHGTFVKFINAILRKFPSVNPQLPQEKTPEALSLRYSYPLFFVKSLILDNGLPEAISIMEAQNMPAPTMMRIRLPLKNEWETNLIIDKPFSVAVIEDPSFTPSIALLLNYYLQNVTPAYLIGNLCTKMAKPPRKILDLCASPGGKSLAVHDVFPSAELFANDVSEEKLNRLQENFIKFGVKANLSISKGEQLISDERFDLIILDVPCSNSGVLNKRPEARWRLSKESLSELENTQLKLIEHAKTLLQPDGQIWFMTCSILKDENERLVQKAAVKFNLKIEFEQSVLPNASGWDGGYAAILRFAEISS